VLSGLDARRVATESDDAIAVADLAALLCRWGGDGDAARQICDDLLESVDDPQTRARVLLARARASVGEEVERLTVLALGEFSAAGDERGRALTLGRMAYPGEGSENAPTQYRLRMGRAGLALAELIGDREVTAFCAGRVASCETDMGKPGALRRWREVAAILEPADLTTATAEASGAHHLNWAYTASEFGEPDEAEFAIRAGRSGAYAATWQSSFDAVEAWLSLRCGDLDEAARLAEPDTVARHHWSDATATLVRAAVAVERERRLHYTPLDEALECVRPAFREMWCWGLTVDARLRAARNEPHPERKLVAALRDMHQRNIRFGWVDTALALAQIDPVSAREHLERLEPMWPSGPRAAAYRRFIAGLLAERHGYADLVAAGTTLAELGEPIPAAQALHAAARCAPDVADGNQLRTRAISLLEPIGADRSLAAVVRDRTLHRGRRVTGVPASQSQQVNPGLTPREREVAMLAAQGLSAHEIGQELNISVGTARNYLLAVREKYGGVPKRQLTHLIQLHPPH